MEGVSGRELGVEIAGRSIMGLRYREVTVREVRSPDGNRRF